MADEKTKEHKPAAAAAPQGEGKPKGGGGGGKSDKKGRKQAAVKVRGPHAGKGLPVPPPRLKAKYEQTIRPKLMQQFGFTNRHQVPTLEKIAINVGVGEAIKQPKAL